MFWLYEVNIRGECDIEAQYRAWLGPHIDQVLAFPGFGTARIFDVESDETDYFHLTVHYQVQSRSLLENYLTQHAPALRADGLNRFGARFSATRRIMRIV
jgi:Domain of unknown function (DUF4286)